MYIPQIDKEHRRLPVLAPHLPLAIPEPLAKGAPGGGFPRPWSVYRWLEGSHARIDRIGDLTGFAIALAGFLTALYSIDGADGPAPGAHSFSRGAPVATWDAETRATIASLGDKIDRAATTEVWDAVVASEWTSPPVWVHGDITPSNLLVHDGRLGAVIDFGCMAVGDPACDLTIAWTLFEGDSRRAFRTGLDMDGDTWRRARGWALWKGLKTYEIDLRVYPDGDRSTSRRFGWRTGARELIGQLVEGDPA
jgi:aminoglycoside phosphotransferase (APT) family kinase protein